MPQNAPGDSRSAYTMVQWMALVCGLAILSTSVLLIYRSFVAKACRTEMLEAISFIKIAQDQYYAEHDRYAGRAELQPVNDEIGLELSPEKLPDLKYMNYEDLFISANYPQSDEYLIIWLFSEVHVLGAKLDLEKMAMDHEGNLYLSGEDEMSDWRPEYPHLQTKDHGRSSPEN